MDIYVYSDESSVLDKKHYKYYTFGALVFFSKESADTFIRKYKYAEKCLREKECNRDVDELKASFISNSDKAKLFRSTNRCYRYGVVINQDYMLDSIFNDKKSKQRFLDYAYKVGLKRYLQSLEEKGVFSSNDVENIYIFCDEHTTATNGLYELKESILQEFKCGTYNSTWSVHFPPIFPNMKSNGVKVKYCDSSKTPLIRASDIIANKVWHAAIDGKTKELPFFVTYLP